MDRFDIVGALRTFATSKGFHFIYGSNEYANTDWHAYTDNELVMVCELNPSINWELGGMIRDITYSGVIMLGRKFDSKNIGTEEEPEIVKTVASLEETMLQKHDRRLKDLWLFLSNYISEFSCTNSLEVQTANGQTLINFYSTLIDFVSFNISFVE